jgi:hypothetical protein
MAGLRGMLTAGLRGMLTGTASCSLHLLPLGLALALAAAPHLVSRAGLLALLVLLMPPSLCVLKWLHSEKLSSP